MDDEKELQILGVCTYGVVLYGARDHAFPSRKRGPELHCLLSCGGNDVGGGPTLFIRLRVHPPLPFTVYRHRAGRFEWFKLRADVIPRFRPINQNEGLCTYILV